MTSLRPFRSFFLLTLLFLTGCDDKELAPASSKVLRPSRWEENGYVRELFFNDRGKLERVKSTSRMADGELIETTQVLIYDASGKTIRTEIDDDRYYEYVYEGEIIVRSNEFQDDTLLHYHTFKYSEAGRLTETEFFQAGTDLPVNKGVYTYDVNGDLITVRTYLFENNEYHLNTTFQYSDFDKQISVDHSFGLHTFNPLLKLLEHNPGRFVVRNSIGNISTTEEYSYRYNDQGYAIGRTAFVTFPHNGNTGSYDAYFYYQPE